MSRCQGSVRLGGFGEGHVPLLRTDDAAADCRACWAAAERCLSPQLPMPDCWQHRDGSIDSATCGVANKSQAPARQGRDATLVPSPALHYWALQTTCVVVPRCVASPLHPSNPVRTVNIITTPPSLFLDSPRLSVLAHTALLLLHHQRDSAPQLLEYGAPPSTFSPSRDRFKENRSPSFDIRPLSDRRTAPRHWPRSP